MASFTWPKLNPGALRNKITFLQSAVVSDVSGSAVSWVPAGEAWASINPMHGIDLIRAGQDVAQLFILVQIYYQPGITTAMRLFTDTGRTLIIQSIEDVDDVHAVLKLNCLELGAHE